MTPTADPRAFEAHGLERDRDRLKGKNRTFFALEKAGHLYFVREARKAHLVLPIQWIKAHGGSKWTEYADALATTYMRS